MTDSIRKSIKSLEAYTAEDAQFFFGREVEMRDLHALASTSQLLLLYGQSGTGKSSLVRCGLHKMFGPEGWRPIYIQRNGNMLEAWLNALGNVDNSTDSVQLLEALTSELLTDSEVPLFFIFDQFEELFLQATEPEIKSFFKAVKIIRTMGPQVRFIFVCREEFLAHFSVAEPVLPDIMASRMRILMMNTGQMSNVLSSILSAAGRAFDSEFLSAFELVLRTEGSGTDLAGFQVYVEYIVSKAPEGQPLTAAHIGGRNSYRRAMERYIARQLATLPVPEKALELLKKLVSSKGTKLRLRKVDFIRIQSEKGGVEGLLNDLVNLRLLRYLPDSDAYELMHDALAKSIFEKFGNTDLERLEVQEFVRLAHQRHQSHQAELTIEDLQYISPHRDFLILSDAESSFLKKAFESHRNRRLERKRNQRILVAVAWLFATIVGYIAFQDQLEKWEVEKLMRASELSASVLSGEIGQSQKSYELAMESYRLNPENLASFEALLASAHHPTLEFVRFENVEVGWVADTLVTVASDSLVYRLKNHQGELNLETSKRMRPGKAPYTQFATISFQDFGYIQFHDSGATSYDYADAQIDQWMNSSGFPKFIRTGHSELLGAIFGDGECIEVLEDGHLQSRGVYTENLNRVGAIQFGNRAGSFDYASKMPADSVVCIESQGDALSVRKMFPVGTEGHCNLNYRKGSPCLCYAEETPLTSRLSIFNENRERVFDEEVGLSFEELKAANAFVIGPDDGSPSWLALDINPSKFHHLGLNKTYELKKSNLLGRHGDVLLLSRSSQESSAFAEVLEDVTLLNRHDETFHFEATHCLGWAPDEEHFLLGKASYNQARYEISIYHWTGAYVRSIILPFQNGTRFKHRKRQARDGSSLHSFEDQKNGETHVLLLSSELEVLGSVVIPDVCDDRVGGAIFPIEDAKAGGTAVWLCEMSRGFVALTYNAAAADRIWPSNRTFFSSACMENVFKAEKNGLHAYTWGDHGWKWSRFVDYPGLSTAGEIETIHCSGDYIKMASGRVLRSSSAGGYLTYDLPDELSNWQFSTSNRHPVTLQNVEGKSLLAWIQFGDSLWLDTTEIECSKWLLDDQKLYAQGVSSGRDSSAFYVANLSSGLIAQYELADDFSTKWELVGAANGNLVLTRWVISEFMTGKALDSRNRLDLSQSILWNPVAGVVWDSIPLVQRIGENLFSSMHITSTSKFLRYTSDLERAWRVNDENRFVEINIPRIFSKIEDRVRLNRSYTKMNYRNGAYMGSDPSTGISFGVDDATGALLHFGSEVEGYHVINEDYGWFESSGMFELRPRSTRAVSEIFDSR